MFTDSLVPYEDRPRILQHYYAMDESLFSSVISLPHNDQRSTLCRNNNFNTSIVRTMLDYSRYFEAAHIQKQLEIRSSDIRGLRVLDFGCLVSDYGLYFARRGASVAIYDNSAAVSFAKFRYARENLFPTAYLIPTAYDLLFDGRDLVVFGEVLEHLEDPLAIAFACVEHKVKYIFTSCYPYGNEHYFAMPGHSKQAQSQQHAFIELMEAHYSSTATAGYARFWERLN